MSDAVADEKTLTDILIIDKFKPATLDDLRKMGWESFCNNDEIVTRETLFKVKAFVLMQGEVGHCFYCAGLMLTGFPSIPFADLSEAVDELNKIVASPFLGGWRESEQP